MGEWIPLVVAIVGATAVFVGHIYNQRAARLHVAAQTFATAIRAVNNYADLPYRVRRRPDSDPSTRWELANRISDLHSEMDFHRAWLRIEAPPVADAYDVLVAVVREEAGPYVKSAWHEPVIIRDSGMNLGLGSKYENPLTDDARSACIEAMRLHLRKRVHRRTG